MSGKLARRTKNLIRKTAGMVGRSPRILNVDTGEEIIGYIDANANATTPFSRGKVHKGFFCTDMAGIEDGHLIYDRGDRNYYFMMDGKIKIYNGEEVYIDGTMYRCDAIVEIQRFEDGVRNTFGRVIKEAPTVVGTGIYAMFNPLNFDTKEQQDRLIASNKIKICLQSKVGVRVADRIIAQDGNKYLVTSIDPVSLTNLVLCTVDTDER